MYLLSHPKPTLYLETLRVYSGGRNRGLGSQAMRRLVSCADRHHLMASLSPDDTYGSSIPRLVRFYKRFGFVENKGKNRDDGIIADMWRPERK